MPLTIKLRRISMNVTHL